MYVLRLLGFIVMLLFPALAISATDYVGKRLLLLDSYHQEYSWSAGISRGVEEILEGSGVTPSVHRMDTKRNRSAEFILEAAEKARDAIEAFAPDIVIISDDNAVKHVLQAFYQDAALPFVFCGVNWDASVYGLPYHNTTGMIEVELIQNLIRQFQPYVRGDRILELLDRRGDRNA